MFLNKLKKNLLIPLLTIIALLIGVSFTHTPYQAKAAETNTYTESIDEIVNPGAGFYEPLNIKLKRNSTTTESGSITVENFIATRKQSYGLLHLLFDLSDFSANADGASVDIDANPLTALENVFKLLKTHKIGAIIRFDYDREGTQVGGQYRNREPDINTIKSHITSLSTVISNYTDVVLGVESGMLGPWGEQHSTTMCSNTDNYYHIVETWLQNTPDTLGITVRTPKYFTYWLNKKFNQNISESQLGTFNSATYLSSERIGVYNDGYLGSADDLGTFSWNTRDAGVAFIGKQSERNFYGGELVADSSKGGIIGNYNDVLNLEREAYKTHTSYLNTQWNDQVIKYYKNNTYQGVNTTYAGKVSQFVFLKNHLGYRFYISSTENATVNKFTNNATFKFTISNVGFSRILIPSRSELVLNNSATEKTVACNVNLKEIPSAGNKDFSLSLDLPIDLPNGTYDAYLRFYTSYGAEIHLANDSSLCLPNRNGVKIGTVKKSPIATVDRLEVITPPTKTQYFIGETIDLTGLEVKAHYSDNTNEIIQVTTDMLTNADTTVAATSQTVTITYEGKTVTFTISVKRQAILSSISATHSNKEYVVGQQFDKSQLTVKAQFDDGTEQTVTDYTLSTIDMTEAGTKTVTVTHSYNGVTKTTTFNVVVKPIAVSSIEVTSPPTKTQYLTGDAINLAGLRVRATYNNGNKSNVTITEEMLSGYDMSTVGNKTVTITYEGKTTTFTIKVDKRVTLSSIVATHSNKEYFAGQAFDKTQLTVKAQFDDGTERTVTDYTLSTIDMTTAGTKTITVTYTFYGVTKTTTFDIVVKEVQVTKIEVTTPPTKTQYFIGDAIDLTGLVVTATYNDDSTSTVKVTTSMLSGCDTSKTGEQTVTITYKEKTATFTITVNKHEVAKTLTGITANYSGKEYFTSQTFEKTQLVVTAQYSDGTKNEVTDYTLSAIDMTEAGTKLVTVTYESGKITKTTTFNFVVKEVTLIKIEITENVIKTNYTAGEGIDLTGLVVIATYSDGSQKPIEVTPSMLSGCDTSVVGAQTVTIQLDGKSVTFDIAVNAPNTTTTKSDSSITIIVIIVCITLISIVAITTLIIILKSRKKS